MLEKLKDLRVILSIVLFLSWTAVGVVGYLYYDSNQKKLSDKDMEIAQLQADLTSIGELVPAYTVASNVTLGKKVEETDLIPIQVPVGAATNLIQDPSEIQGKFYRLNLTAGTAINTDSIMDSEIADDTRLYDVILNTIPIMLKEGTYVDVRITLPMGEDFIAIPHKKVHSVNNSILKLALSEKDIHTYNSLLFDALMYPGTVLYAAEYVEGGVQKAADAFYPVSANIVAVAEKDPNLLDAIKADILQKRSNLEQNLSQLDSGDTRKESVDKILQRGRERYQDVLKEANNEAIRNEQKRLDDLTKQAEINAIRQQAIQGAQPQAQQPAK
ncbi:hypothetical protein D3C71_1282110 [compost metagenome]